MKAGDTRRDPYHYIPNRPERTSERQLQILLHISGTCTHEHEYTSHIAQTLGCDASTVQEGIASLMKKKYVAQMGYLHIKKGKEGVKVKVRKLGITDLGINAANYFSGMHRERLTLEGESWPVIAPERIIPLSTIREYLSVGNVGNQELESIYQAVFALHYSRMVVTTDSLIDCQGVCTFDTLQPTKKRDLIDALHSSVVNDPIYVKAKMDVGIDSLYHLMRRIRHDFDSKCDTKEDRRLLTEAWHLIEQLQLQNGARMNV